MRAAHRGPLAVWQGVFVFALAGAWVLAPAFGRGAPCTRARAANALPAAVARGASATAGRAGLVVEFGDGTAREYCVSLPGSEISGLELLRASGLDLAYQDFGGGQVTVCRIAADGPDFPSKPCFSGCPDPERDCRFWGYYAIDRPTGAWRFSEEGAAARRLRDGDVDGWRWGTHSGGGGPPRATSLAEICRRGDPVAAGGPVGGDRARPPGPGALGVFGGGVAALGLSGALLGRRRRRAEGAA